MSSSPALGMTLTLFLASLTGISPFGLWIAKLQAFKPVIDASDTPANGLAVVAASTP